MDQFSELEAKFKAPNIEPDELLHFLASVGFVHGYKVVEGIDEYYHEPKNNHVVRLRYDEDTPAVLTIKRRKSAESILDRHEVDLPLAINGTPFTEGSEGRESLMAARWFLHHLDLKRVFDIWKHSYITHVAGFNSILVCVALYDVSFENHDPDRYLEVEVDKSNFCSEKQAELVLANWIQLLQSRFALGEPLNQSLFEIYHAKTQK